MSTQGFVYILEFDQPLGSERHQARYYLGFAFDVGKRLAQHRAGVGAAITRAANERGIGYKVVMSIPGDRALERKLKAQKNTPRIVARYRRAYGMYPH